MKTQFQRWYGCDESDRLDLTSAVAAQLGTHVVVPEGILDPVDDDTIFVNSEAALPGVYMLQSVSGWTDTRNGSAPFIVAGYYVWVRSDDPSGRYPKLKDFECGAGLDLGHD